MIIKNKQVGGKGMFYIEQEGKIVAEMVYSMRNPNQMIIEHTEVSEELGGKGIGLQLVKAGVEHARTNHLKIIPLCPFAKSVFDKKAEFRDVLLK